MAGRPPGKMKLVENTEGSETAKRRLRLILETLWGERTIKSACEDLEIGEAMFHKLRSRFLQESVEGFETRKPGVKPARESEAREEIADLNERIKELESEVKRARVREEIALVLAQARVEDSKKGL